MLLSTLINILSALTWSQNQTEAPDARGIGGPAYSLDGSNDIPHSISADFTFEFAPIGSSDEQPEEELNDVGHVPFIDLTPLFRGQLIDVEDPLTDMRLMNEAKNADSDEPVEVESPFIDLTQEITNQTQQPEEPFPLGRLLERLIHDFRSANDDASAERHSAETRTPYDEGVPVERSMSEAPEDAGHNDKEVGLPKEAEPALHLVAEEGPNGTIVFRHPSLIDFKTGAALSAAGDSEPSPASSTPSGSESTAVAVQSPTEEEANASAEKNFVKSSLQEALFAVEDTMLERLHDVYLKIAQYNSFSYDKNQAIQYLSYSQKKKQDIIDEQTKLKQEILEMYKEKLVPAVRAAERLRSRMLMWDPQSRKNVLYSAPWSPYWPEAADMPRSLILLYNLETILLQLYTPKPAILTTFDEREKRIHLRRRPNEHEGPRGFIPLTNSVSEPIDRLFDIENNHENPKFEQETFAMDALEQKIVVYYTFKYFEYKSGDFSREVKYIVKRLEQLEKYGQAQSLEYTDMKTDLRKKLAELQYVAEQMETYRTIPELVDIFNAETAAKKYVPDAKFVTELKGSKENNVRMRPLKEVLEEGSSEVDSRKAIDDPLEWDKNWSWDF